jgi:GT2 family glycosyltransferase
MTATGGDRIIKPMLFSVIIPAFNREQHLPEALESVWKQTFKDYEVIVVDDGSTDGTPAYLSTLDGRVSVIRQSNAGPGMARNRGAEAARGDYLAFLDSDDLWFPWTLEVFANLLTKYGEPALISGIARPFEHPSDHMGCTQGALQVLHFPNYLASSGKSPFTVGSNTLVVRRTVFSDAKGFPDHRMNAEDHDFVLRMGTSSGFVQIASPWTAGWRAHGGNSTAQVDKTAGGLMYVISQEKNGRYPGGSALRRSRLRIISAHVRPVAAQCLRIGMHHDAWLLYLGTFWWHLELLRGKFLAGFVLAAIWNSCREMAIGICGQLSQRTKPSAGK